MQKQGKLASELGLYGLVVPSEEVALKTAEFIALRSSCVRGQIGALVLNRLNMVMGVGWNIEYPAESHCATDCPRVKSNVPSLSSYREGPGRCISTHAEINALRDAEGGPEPLAVMVVSYTPCPDCRATLSSIDGLQVISGTRRTVR